MSEELRFTQPITRVHNIYRIRTVVNAVTGFNFKKKGPGDEEIGMVLARMGLSKFRRYKIKDRIMRRARDHLLTASYMGLLTRAGRPFEYWSTKAGRVLNSYGIDEECPKDPSEEAVFIDKIMRLKLTNVFDLQIGKHYLSLRSRPCLYILYILNKKSWLHEHQIAIATGGDRCDPLLRDAETARILSSVSGYAGVDKGKLNKFYDSFGIGGEDRRNMTRNVRPLLDWCESVGLIESRDIPGVGGRWYRLTERGKMILSRYKKKYPLWYSDLGGNAPAKAAILLFYRFIRLKNLSVGKKFLDYSFKTGLVRQKVRDIVKGLKKMNLRFGRGYSTLLTDVDFTFEYDVPPKDARMVEAILKQLCRVYDLKVNEILDSVELDAIDELRFALQREHAIVRKRETEAFATRAGEIPEHARSKVPSLVPSVGVLSQYRSDFEREIAVFLRLIELNANKYQGQLADRCKRSHVMRFFENNPDILITNGVEVLVECKSSGEWKSPLSGEKSVPKEVFVYQQYFPEIKSNSVVIVYEGRLDAKSLVFIKGLLEDARDVVFVTKNYLVNCLQSFNLRDRLMKVMKRPKKYGAEDRLFRR